MPTIFVLLAVLIAAIAGIVLWGRQKATGESAGEVHREPPRPPRTDF